MVQTLWKTIWQFLKKIKYRIIIWPSNFTSGHIPKEKKAGIQTGIYTPMFIIALFPIAKNQKQTICPSTDE